MKIETINPKDKIPITCPKCNTPLNKTYCRYEALEIDADADSFDLKVFKCQKCPKVYAYWIDNSFRHSRFEDNEEENSEPTENEPIKDTRKPPVPKKCAEEYSKAISVLETKNKEMDRLIQEKLLELNKAGLSLETINYSKQNSPVPQNQKVILQKPQESRRSSFLRHRQWRHNRWRPLETPRRRHL